MPPYDEPHHNHNHHHQHHHHHVGLRRPVVEIDIHPVLRPARTYYPVQAPPPPPPPTRTEVIVVTPATTYVPQPAPPPGHYYNEAPYNNNYPQYPRW